MKAGFRKHILQFIVPGGTSRGVLKEKESWFLKISEGGIDGYGEISIIPGLSIDPTNKMEEILDQVCKEIESGQTDFDYLTEAFPAVHFAIEQAFADWENCGTGLLFKNDFSLGKSGIAMNGLVWMNPVETMKTEGEKKIASGFHCLKFKIGSYDFNDEFELLKYFRDKFGDQLVIRVDANGAFNQTNIFQVMNKLEQLKIHSIEQPIKPGQYSLMSKICKECAVPVALDEELIGIKIADAKNLIAEIKPAYLILKPSLLGGWKKSDQWIKLTEEKKTGWWVTSALESNIGLNAIAQWAGGYDLKIPQGLGTGSLYKNNFSGGLKIIGDELWNQPEIQRTVPF